MAETSASGKVDQKLKLKDGRTLGFAEYGDPNGKPVLEFHGWPGCRYEAWNYDEAGRKTGARVIGVDRPGFGMSTYKKGYRIVDWPRDVVEFADALGLQKFRVMGISSGSPYSLACARFIPERLTACSVVSGISPLKVPGEKLRPRHYVEPTEIQLARLANFVSPIARLGLWYIARQIRKDPDKALRQFTKDMPESDLDLLKDPDARQNFVNTVTECMRHGTRGPIASVGLEMKPWGFALSDITMHVSLWQGEDDNLVYPAAAAYMASKLPNHTLHTIADAGHLAVVARHAEEVMRELLSTD